MNCCLSVCSMSVCLFVCCLFDYTLYKSIKIITETGFQLCLGAIRYFYSEYDTVNSMCAKYTNQSSNIRVNFPPLEGKRPECQHEVSATRVALV